LNNSRIKALFLLMASCASSWLAKSTSASPEGRPSLLYWIQMLIHIRGRKNCDKVHNTISKNTIGRPQSHSLVLQSLEAYNPYGCLASLSHGLILLTANASDGSRQRLRFAARGVLVTCPTFTYIGARSFAVAGPTAWNQLLADVHSTESVNSLKPF